MHEKNIRQDRHRRIIPLSRNATYPSRLLLWGKKVGLAYHGNHIQIAEVKDVLRCADKELSSRSRKHCEEM